jgi:hypothetical protein
MSGPENPPVPRPQGPETNARDPTTLPGQHPPYAQPVAGAAAPLRPPTWGPAADGRPVWLYVIGAVSMVLAGWTLAMLAGWMMYMGASLIQQGPWGLRRMLSSSYGSYQLLYTARHVLRGLTGGILMVAGCCLAKRSRFAPMLHILYAVAALVLSLGLPVAHLLVGGRDIEVRGMIWPVWSAIVEAAYPVFLLVWFSRAKVKQQVRVWLQ